MADISILTRILNGLPRGVDVSQNALVVGSLKVGSTSPVEITKAIATKLIAIQAASDADGTFDTRYNTKVITASTSTGQGASLTGIEDAGTYFTGTNVEAALQELGAAMGSGDASGISYDGGASGLTATNVQDAIDEVEDRLETTEGIAITAIQSSEKGANNGVATLDGGGKVPVSQLPSAVMTLEGEYNATTNTPTLIDGTGDPGMVYEVTVAGTQDFGSGNITFNVGDWVVYAGGVWYKSVNSNEVTSVNGQTGPVTLTTDDVGEGGTNKYFTDERAQDAVGATLTDTATIDLIYNDGSNTISADVKDNSIDEDKITTSIADQVTITGGNGTPLSAVASNTIKRAADAGESMAADVTFAVRMALTGETAGRVYKADKDASSLNAFFAIGLAKSVAGASAGDPVPVTMFGTHELGTNDTPFGAGDIGMPVYLTTAGAFSVTPPSAADEAVFKVGMVETTTKILISGMQLHGVN